MKRNWIVVANAARARVLEQTDQLSEFTELADLVHPQSRQTAVDMAREHGGGRPGHVQGMVAGQGSASFSPHTDPREREHERFAREVAAQVNRGVAAGHCAGITLVASDPFLGELKAHLSVPARKLLLRTVASDYTGLSHHELAQRLGGVPA
jgi:protein required for attachment to host cells